jgi:exopolysaccharide biosynthesis polyprenyl glycosylphosphotransferase
MQRLRRRLILDAYRVADLCAMCVAFGLALMVSAGVESPNNPTEFFAVRIKLLNALLFMGFAVLWHMILRARGLYELRRVGLRVSEWWAVTKGVALGTLILAGLGFVAKLDAVDRRFLAVFFGVSLVATIVARVVVGLAMGERRQSRRALRNLVIVGCGPRGAQLGAEVWSRPDLGYLLLGYIDDIPAPANPLHGQPEKLLGGLADARRLLRELEVDEVMICLPVRSQYEAIAGIVSAAGELGLTVRMPVNFFDSRSADSQIDYLNETPVVTLTQSEPIPSGLLVKRVVDIFGSALALLMLAPVFLLIALAIRVGSRGPVFFSQERVGLGRRKFRMWKFRSMVEDAEERQAALEQLNEVQGAAFKMREDPRVTRIGHLLRRSSLDELPQLYNVLVGDMSLVGPRPLPLRDVARLSDSWQLRRFSMKPGITCLWQINGRHEINFNHWMELDLQYIDSWSPALDIEILAKTLPAVLRGSGAS